MPKLTIRTTININKYLTIFIIFNAKIQRIFEKKEFLEKRLIKKAKNSRFELLF